MTDDAAKAQAIELARGVDWDRALIWVDGNPVPCVTDEAGFHITVGDGRRVSQRLGIDGYAYRCSVCGTVGDIKDGRFVPRE